MLRDVLVVAARLLQLALTIALGIALVFSAREAAYSPPFVAASVIVSLAGCGLACWCFLQEVHVCARLAPNRVEQMDVTVALALLLMAWALRVYESSDRRADEFLALFSGSVAGLFVATAFEPEVHRCFDQRKSCECEDRDAPMSYKPARTPQVKQGQFAPPMVHEATL